MPNILYRVYIFLFFILPPFRLLRRARTCQGDTPINIYFLLRRVVLLFCANCANGCERLFPRPPLPSLSKFYRFVKTFFIRICLRIFAVNPTRRKTQNFLSLPNRYQKHLTNTHYVRTQTDTPTNSKMPPNALLDPCRYDYLQTGVSPVRRAYKGVTEHIGINTRLSALIRYFVGILKKVCRNPQ
jgi:hypothetical protein